MLRRYLLVFILCGFSLPAKAQDPQKAAPSEKPRLLFLDLTASLVDLEEVNVLTKLFGTKLDGYTGYDVITSTDLRQMAALEAEKQKAFGCSDSSCLAELAGAMGARFIIFGDVGKLGSKIILTLNLFDSTEAKAVARGSLLVQDLSEIPEKIPNLLDNILLKPKSVGNQDQEPIVQAIIEDQQPKAQEPAAQTVAKADKNTEQAQFFDANSTHSLIAAGVFGLSGALAGLWGLSSYAEVYEKESAFFDGVRNVENRNIADAAQKDYMSGPVWGLWGGSILVVGSVTYISWAMLKDKVKDE